MRLSDKRSNEEDGGYKLLVDSYTSAQELRCSEECDASSGLTPSQA